MPAISTPDSAPEDTALRPAAERSEATGAPLVPSAERHAVPEIAALDESDDGGFAAPVDERDLGKGVSPPLDHAVRGCCGLADVAVTASFMSGISNSFQPLAGLGTMLSELAAPKDFGLAPAIANIKLPIPVLPNIGDTVSRSLLGGLETHKATLSMLAGARHQVLSLSEARRSVLQVSAANRLGLLNTFATAKAALPTVEPQINSLVGVLGTASRLTSMADSFQPLGGLGTMLSKLAAPKDFGLAPGLKDFTALMASLPSPAKLTGSLTPAQQILRTHPPLTDLIGSHWADLFARFRSVADWAKRLKPSVLAEARYAFDAYVKGDTRPMKEFLHRCLRLWPVLEDHCQALAVAMLERAWEQEADLTDDQSVRRVLIQYARQGCDFERDHQIRGVSVGYIPDGWQQPDTMPGPEDLVIPRLLPWAQQFETAPVRYVAGQLNEKEQALVRAWSENHPMTWPTASDLVHQDEAQGERARRKLNRLGKEWRRRENNRQELP
ncbi:hypothetical protein N7U49_47760 (plasmid) [Streptomyces sp. AD2-2]|nr:hypothetical protein N7U49_47760 [Streptomyces sp. AD2-2]